MYPYLMISLGVVLSNSPYIPSTKRWWKTRDLFFHHPLLGGSRCCEGGELFDAILEQVWMIGWVDLRLFQHTFTWNPKQPFINGCLVKQPFPM